MAIATINVAEVLEGLNGDEELLVEIVDVLLEEAAQLMQGVRDAVAAGDAHRLERAAHSLKGSVSIFGVQPVTQAAQGLEAMGRAGELNGAASALATVELQMEDLLQALTALKQEYAQSPIR